MWLAVAIAVGLALWFVPTPAGLEPNAWHLFAIFVATIVGIIAKAAPMGALSIVAMALCAATQVLAPGDTGKSIANALSGFSNGTIWLIVSAFFAARAVISSGLGERLAYLFVRIFGRSTIGLAYGLGFADLVTSPAIPSNTARSGYIYPVMKSIAETSGSKTEDPTTHRRIGSYLAMACYNLNLAVSVIFFTGAAPNAMSAKLAGEAGVTVDWGGWLLAAVVPGLVGVVLVPIVLYFIYAPEVKKTPDAPRYAAAELRRLGKVKRNEWLTIGVFVFMIGLWMAGDKVMNSTTVALIGLSVLLLSGALTWEQMKAEKAAWDTLTWFAALVMMGSYLNSLGLHRLVRRPGRRLDDRHEPDGRLRRPHRRVRPVALHVRQRHRAHGVHVRGVPGSRTGARPAGHPAHGVPRRDPDADGLPHALRQRPGAALLRLRLRRTRRLVAHRPRAGRPAHGDLARHRPAVVEPDRGLALTTPERGDDPAPRHPRGAPATAHPRGSGASGRSRADARRAARRRQGSRLAGMDEMPIHSPGAVEPPDTSAEAPPVEASSPRRPLRIALFTDNYGPSPSGVLYAVQFLERQLLAQGFEVQVVAPACSGPNPYRGRPGRTEMRLPSMKLPGLPMSVANGRSFERALDAFAADPPDVIHVQGLGTVGMLGVWAADRTERPLMVTWHTDFAAYADYYAAMTPFLDAYYRLVKLATHGMKRPSLRDMQRWIKIRPLKRGMLRRSLINAARDMLEAAEIVTTPSEKTPTRGASWPPPGLGGGPTAPTPCPSGRLPKGWVRASSTWAGSRPRRTSGCCWRRSAGCARRSPTRS